MTSKDLTGPKGRRTTLRPNTLLLVALVLIGLIATSCGNTDPRNASTPRTGEAAIGFVEGNHPLRQALPSAETLGDDWTLQGITSDGPTTRSEACGSLFGPITKQFVARYENLESNTELGIGVADVGDNADDALTTATAWVDCSLGDESVVQARIVEGQTSGLWDEVSIEIGLFFGNESEIIGRVLLAANGRMRAMAIVEADGPSSAEPASFVELGSYLAEAIKRLDQIDPGELDEAAENILAEEPSVVAPPQLAYVVTEAIPAGTPAAQAIRTSIEVREVPVDLLPQARVVDLAQIEGMDAETDLSKDSVLVIGMFDKPGS